MYAFRWQFQYASVDGWGDDKIEAFRDGGVSVHG